jgi:hypothetical protein
MGEIISCTTGILSCRVASLACVGSATVYLKSQRADVMLQPCMYTQHTIKYKLSILLPDCSGNFSAGAQCHSCSDRVDAVLNSILIVEQ